MRRQSMHLSAGEIELFFEGSGFYGNSEYPKVRLKFFLAFPLIGGFTARRSQLTLPRPLFSPMKAAASFLTECTTCGGNQRICGCERLNCFLGGWDFTGIASIPKSGSNFFWPSLLVEDLQPLEASRHSPGLYSSLSKQPPLS